MATALHPQTLLATHMPARRWRTRSATRCGCGPRRSSASRTRNGSPRSRSPTPTPAATGKTRGSTGTAVYDRPQADHFSDDSAIFSGGLAGLTVPHIAALPLPPRPPYLSSDFAGTAQQVRACVTAWKRRKAECRGFALPDSACRSTVSGRAGAEPGKSARQGRARTVPVVFPDPQLPGDARGEGGSTGLDDDFAARSMEALAPSFSGATCSGRFAAHGRMTSGRAGGDNPPYHAPTFVLTHHPRRSRSKWRAAPRSTS